VGLLIGRRALAKPPVEAGDSVTMVPACAAERKTRAAMTAELMVIMAFSRIATMIPEHRITR
jgi:hypothetical protein